MNKFVFPLIILFAFAVNAQQRKVFTPSLQSGNLLHVKNYHRQSDGVVFNLTRGKMELQILSDDIIRVRCAPADTFPTRESVSVIRRDCQPVHFSITDNKTSVDVSTGEIKAEVDKTTGAVAFYDNKDRLLLQEAANGKSMVDTTIAGEKTWTAEEKFLSPKDEALYGLGQFQDGIMNWKNVYARLKQRNTNIAMPVIISNKGYGLFWDNTSYTEFNPDIAKLDVKPVGDNLSAMFKSKEKGTYVFVIERENVNAIELKVGGKTIYRHDTGVHVSSSVAKVDLEANKEYPVEFISHDKKLTPAIPEEYLIPADGKPGEHGLKGEYFANRNLEGTPSFTRIDPKVDFDWGSGSPAVGFPTDNFSVRWTGKLVVPKTIDSCVLTVTSDDGARLYVDGKMVTNGWVERGSTTDEYRMKLEAGREYDIKLEYFEAFGGASAKFGWDTGSSGTDNELSKDVHIYYRTPGQSKETVWKSLVADDIDYYFMYGPDGDKIVNSMRELTGTAPLYPKWAYGLFLSHMAWNTQDEIIDVAKGHIQRNIPFDCIVQDGTYWKQWPENEWGSSRFDSARYPDPTGMIKAVHDMNRHFMISVWPRFNSNTDTYKMLAAKGYMLGLQETSAAGNEGVALEDVTTNAAYDAFNPGARKMYWQFINDRLFSMGVDAWWLDATEPEWGYDFSKAHTYLGTGERYLNCYALMSMKGVYEGQRSTESTKRPYLLTRSAFPGEQRYAVTAWSGDIGYDWNTYRIQIAAGLNFTITGMPYWTTDIGGFVPGADPNDPAYRELLTRWFQYGAFCPIFRVHGCRPTELWRGGEESEKELVESDNLRYRLMPYIYSLGAMVTFDNYTIMRPLIMDFRNDNKIVNIADQFMFGTAFLVNPVIEPKAASRKVYLPSNKGGWYNFWTGEKEAGGKTIETPAPIDIIPLFVKAGSIVPIGPYEQYAAEKNDPIELRIYTGANGTFTLYEDENDNFNYEKGKRATIQFTWDQKTKTLVIGKRIGEFDGMLKDRTFNIVFVNKSHGVGIAPEAKPDKTILYNGSEIKIKI